MENIYEDVSRSQNEENGEWSEIAENNVSSTMENLKQHWPRSAHVYNFITENIKFGRKSGRTNIHLYCNKQNGLLVASAKGMYRRAAIFSCNDDYSGIESALQGNNVINWDDGSITLHGLPLGLYEYLYHVSPSIGKCLLPCEDIFDCYWMSAEAAKALKVECPDDMYFSKLEDIHADIVNSTWFYRSYNPPDMVIDMIKHMETLGLFTKKDSKLVSWVFNAIYGVGMLYTVEEHRNKGYGTLVLRKLANHLGNLGINPTLVTLKSNIAAKNAFQKSGFEFVESLKFPCMKQN